MLNVVLDNEARDLLKDLNVEHIPTIVVHNSIPIEIDLRKTLNINANLNDLQHENLIQILQKYK